MINTIQPNYVQQSNKSNKPSFGAINTVKLFDKMPDQVFEAFYEGMRKKTGAEYLTNMESFSIKMKANADIAFSKLNSKLNEHDLPAKTEQLEVSFRKFIQKIGFLKKSKGFEYFEAGQGAKAIPIHHNAESIGGEITTDWGHYRKREVESFDLGSKLHDDILKLFPHAKMEDVEKTIADTTLVPLKDKQVFVSKFLKQGKEGIGDKKPLEKTFHHNIQSKVVQGWGLDLGSAVSFSESDMIQNSKNEKWLKLMQEMYQMQIDARQARAEYSKEISNIYKNSTKDIKQKDALAAKKQANNALAEQVKKLFA